MIKFAQRLKELRKERNLKQSELGKILSVDQRSISCWENGSREPDYETLAKIALYFQESADYLLGIEDRLK
ncbi:MAG: helix-turn-helix domain-containing protein [Clostridia bacterium]|nr:helix-turn-helix domain-containing protein [Clostridia bacterium]